MKRVAICFVVLIWSYGASAQVTKEILDRNTPVTWLGLDFTPTRFIGDGEKLPDERTIKRVFTELNQLMLKEADKYDVAKALHRKTVKIALDPAIEHNSKLDVKDKVLDRGTMFRISPLEIQGILETYDFGTEKGLGAIIVVDCFSKVDLNGVLWFAFVDIDTRKLVYAERFVAAPGGFGLRNYWATTVRRTLDQVKSRFEMWRANK